MTHVDPEENPGNQPIQFNPNRGDNNIEHEDSDDHKEVHGLHHITHGLHQVFECISDSNTKFMDNRKVHHMEGHKPTVLLQRAKDKRREFKHIAPIRISKFLKKDGRRVTLFIIPRDMEPNLKKLMGKEKKKILKIRFDGGQTALHLACQQRDEDAVRSLLKMNADPNDLDEEQSTPLHISCTHGDLSIIALLLSKNAKVTARLKDGNTPLHLLAVHKPPQEKITIFYQILEDIKNSGANVNIRNQQGETPLHIACLHSAEKAAMWLIRQGASVSIVSANGETALHYATRHGSETLIRLLANAGGICEHKSSQKSLRDTALLAGRETIAALLDELSESETTEPTETLVINGNALNMTKLQEYKQICSDAVEKLFKSNDMFRTSEQTEAKNIIHRACLMLSLIETNIDVLVNSSTAKQDWSGELRCGHENENNPARWVTYFSFISNNELTLHSTPMKSPNNQKGCFPLDVNLSFEVYFDDPSRFSIIYFGNELKERKIEHFAVAQGNSCFQLLKILMMVSGQPVETIGGKDLLYLIEKLGVGDKPAPSRVKSTEFLRGSMTSTKKRKLRVKSFPKDLSLRKDFPVRRKTDSLVHPPKILVEPGFFPFVLENGTIICDTNFCSFLFSDVFSSELSMKEEIDDKHYLLMSGSFSDLLHYCILHSHPKQFQNNTDVKAFYMCYYRYSEPQDVVYELAELWQIHTNTYWPPPYSDVSPEIRLYHFIEGFIQSPFVLLDLKQEITFRTQLADTYAKLVDDTFPDSSPYSACTLRELLLKIRRSKELLSINQSCDLQSLFKDTSKAKTDHDEKDLNFINAVDVDVVVSQIVSINADLYQQIRIRDLIDLRFQKDSQFARSINKVLDFSNKIFLLVPTTILQSDDPLVQRSAVKKWISIAMKLFQLREYNSSIQIANGVADVSIMRLKHIKDNIPIKWLERLDTIREHYSPIGNFANYRKLSKEPPCIPFTGVAMKDLIFAYEGNPDYDEKGAINFSKMRLIVDIFNTLKIEQPEQIDYSHLELDTQVAHALLNATTLTQEQLYKRSKEISDMINIGHTEDVMLLKKEIRLLRNEVLQLRQSHNDKDEIIRNLMQQLQEKSDTSIDINMPPMPEETNIQRPTDLNEDDHSFENSL